MIVIQCQNHLVIHFLNYISQSGTHDWQKLLGKIICILGWLTGWLVSWVVGWSIKPGLAMHSSLFPVYWSYCVVGLPLNFPSSCLSATRWLKTFFWGGTTQAPTHSHTLDLAVFCNHHENLQHVFTLSSMPFWTSSPSLHIPLAPKPHISFASLLVWVMPAAVTWKLIWDDHSIWPLSTKEDSPQGCWNAFKPTDLLWALLHFPKLLTTYSPMESTHTSP